MSLAPLQADVTAEKPPSAGELIGRAQLIAATLVDRQAETEQRTYYAEDTHAAFAEAGLYRLLVPKRYGGYEIGIDDYFRIGMAIARGCPSTGWCFTLGTSHTLTVASYFSEQAQDELFALPDFICPTTLKPEGSASSDADGGWIINGEFHFCSGAPYGTHYMGHAVPRSGEPSGPMLFIAPRSTWTRLDDWGDQIGLKGSGSHSIRFDGGRIPQHFAIPDTTFFTLDRRGGTIGSRLHDNPMYAGGVKSFFSLEVAALSVGIAQGALDAYEVLLRSKTTPFPPFASRKDNADYQRWFGTAMGKITTAEAAVINAAQQWMELAATDAFTDYQDLRLVTIAKEVMKLSWDAVQQSLVRTAGSTSMRSGQTIERIFRDSATVHSHNGIVSFAELSTIGVAQSHLAQTLSPEH
jgi:3-hydroxy-9,10-secoandrosta-1,3,5(10)-triene-9,17-dione monooxygenase